MRPTKGSNGFIYTELKKLKVISIKVLHSEVINMMEFS